MTNANANPASAFDQETLDYLRNEGIELSDDVLDVINGGAGSTNANTACPACKGTNTHPVGSAQSTILYCSSCRTIFNKDGKILKRGN
jgi:hypothetical protein